MADLLRHQRHAEEGERRNNVKELIMLQQRWWQELRSIAQDDLISNDSTLLEILNFYAGYKHIDKLTGREYDYNYIQYNASGRQPRIDDLIQLAQTIRQEYLKAKLPERVQTPQIDTLQHWRDFAYQLWKLAIEASIINNRSKVVVNFIAHMDRASIGIIRHLATRYQFLVRYEAIEETMIELSLINVRRVRQRVNATAGGMRPVGWRWRRVLPCAFRVGAEGLHRLHADAEGDISARHSARARE
eukprot:148272-Hanusia_phi.AAC.3